MTNCLLRQSTTVVLTALLILLGGCSSSSPTRFYVLRSWSDSMNKKELQPSDRERCVSIGVGPVKVADYLDRPQIVTRVTPNEVKIAEFDQWAEPLGQNISRVLADNLSALLCTKVVVVFPWRCVGSHRLPGRSGDQSAGWQSWWEFYTRSPMDGL